MDRLTDTIMTFTTIVVWYSSTCGWRNSGDPHQLDIFCFCRVIIGMHLYFGIQMLRRFSTRVKRTVYKPAYTAALFGFLPSLIAPHN